MNRVIKPVDVTHDDDVFRVFPEEQGPTPEMKEASAAIDGAKKEIEKMHSDARREVESSKKEMEELSRRILRSANAEAEKITRTAQEKAADLRRTAQQEGYAEALRQHSEKLKDTLDTVGRMLDEMTKRQERFFAAYNAELESLALGVAEKIMARSLETDPNVMAELVMQAVGSVRTEEWITVEISDKLPGLIEYMQREYAGYLSKRQVEFTAENVPKGTCVVQTATGITDASIATQLGNLRELMQISTPEG